MIRIGIDVGGTGIQVGAINERYEIVSQGSIKTNTEIPFETQVYEMAQCVKDTVTKAGLTEDDIHSVGVGIPGIADLKTGDIIKCTNMNWHHVPFRREFQKWLNKPVFIDNDANVAALAESVCGVSAGTDSSVFITLGTGIGSGIILNGKIWNGYHGIGGELGHVIMCLDGVPCSCGNHGCLERYCSATAIIRMGKEALLKHQESLMNSMVHGDPDKLNAKIVFDAAREKDPTALEVYETYTTNLAQAIAGVVNLIDPELIVLGGGVCKAGDFLLDPLREKYKEYVLFNDQPLPDIRIARLGSEAGIIGAAMLQ